MTERTHLSTFRRDLEAERLLRWTRLEVKASKARPHRPSGGLLPSAEFLTTPQIQERYQASLPREMRAVLGLLTS